MLQQCPRCGRTGRTEGVHGTTRSMVCLRCGEAWSGKINGDTSYDDVILLKFDGVLGPLVIRAGRRRVRLAAIASGRPSVARRRNQ
jgi:transposase-like protein